MKPQSGRLQALLALPQERSIEKRRAVLADIAQLFRERSPASQRQTQELGEALVQILPDLDLTDRRFLAERVAPLKEAPTYLIRQLAGDAPDVAAPVLASSPLLSEGDLKEIASKGSEERLKAIAQRSNLPESLQQAIAKSAGTATLGVLLQNKSFALTRELLSRLIVRARSDERIASRLAARRDVPVNVLAELFLVLKTDARVALTHNLAKSTEFAPQPAVAKPEGEAALVKAVRNVDPAALLRAFDAYWKLSDKTVERIMRDPTCEALAVLCLGLGISRATYSTLAVLTRTEPNIAPHRMAVMLGHYERFAPDGARRIALEWQRTPPTGQSLRTAPAKPSVAPSRPPKAEAPAKPQEARPVRGKIFGRNKSKADKPGNGRSKPSSVFSMTLGGRKPSGI